MIKFITKAILTSVAVLVADFFLDGIKIEDTLTAMIVAVILGLLNTFIKPVLVMLTIPFTVFTLGLFLLVINIIIIYLAAEIVPSFTVASWWSALLFSFIVSFVFGFLERWINKYKIEKEEEIQEF
jgi:putative membrane protein